MQDLDIDIFICEDTERDASGIEGVMVHMLNHIEDLSWSLELGIRSDIKRRIISVLPLHRFRDLRKEDMPIDETPHVDESERQPDSVPEYDDLFYVVLPSIEKALSIAQTKDEIAKGFKHPKKVVEDWLKEAEKIGKVKKLPGRPVKYIATSATRTEQLECSFTV